VHRDPSGFLTSPSLLDGFALKIFDSFAMAGSVSTSLTYSWNLFFFEKKPFVPTTLEQKNLLDKLYSYMYL
jgi:hypothetical protein